MDIFFDVMSRFFNIIFALTKFKLGGIQFFNKVPLIHVEYTNFGHPKQCVKTPHIQPLFEGVVWIDPGP